MPKEITINLEDSDHEIIARLVKNIIHSIVVMIGIEFEKTATEIYEKENPSAMYSRGEILSLLINLKDDITKELI